MHLFEKEVRKTIPFTIASKRKKCVGISLTRDLSKTATMKTLKQ
jgi:hypothetical protein